MAEDQEEKTEQATDARREDFRKRGQVAQTRELGSAVILFAGAAGVTVLSQYFFKNLVELLGRSFGTEMVRLIREGNITEALQFSGIKIVMLIAPVFAIVAILGAGSTVLQIGFLQVEDALSLNLDKINPISGFKRVFSLRGLAEGFKALLKMVGLAAILWMLLRSEVHQIPYLISYSVNQLMSYIGVVFFKLFFGVGIVTLVLAASDYFFQRWQLEKEMMMTKQEIKEEHKQQQGDPMIKARIRRVQREVANRRMMDAVPKADVVITNPTHLAVVLKYDANLPAPQLVAKGADLIAERIKELAREHNIPVIENKPLARTIFKTLKIGQVIPRELFVAVAEVLSFVYKLKRKRIKQ